MSGASQSGSNDAVPSFGHTISELTKFRLTSMVLVTTAVGYALGRYGAASFEWSLLGWTMLGSALAAAGCAMLNQVIEVKRDSAMERTKNRPIPAGVVSRAAGFAGGLLVSYAGVSLLAATVNLLAAGLTLLTIVVYLLIYTPLKPITTLNTLVGAISGALPPMIGWVAATGRIEAGAWVIGGVLFVWQLPHFFALAWMYREDYERGGHAMLPVLDPSGNITGRVMVSTALLLVPIGLSATLFGVAGWVSAAASVVLGLWFSWKCLGFWQRRDRASARRVFLASLLYLPLLLMVMVADRGPVTPEAWLRGGRGPLVDVRLLPEPATEPSP
jgi:protoheme IX farnesyltransferase